MNSISERLKFALNLRGVTAAELARRLNVSKASVSLWLSATTKDLAATNALNAAKVLDVDPYWLVFGTGGLETKLSTKEQNIIGAIRKLDDDSKDLAEKLISKISA